MTDGTRTTTTVETEGQLPYPYGSSSSEEEVTAEVLNALHWDAAIPLDRLRVQVTEGRVELSGSVEREYQRDLAQVRASAVEGVIEVDNAVVVEK